MFYIIYPDSLNRDLILDLIEGKIFDICDDGFMNRKTIYKLKGGKE